mgnify:CR=1 FL=1
MWGATHKTKLLKLENLQKHACKVISYKKRRDSAIPVMEDFKILRKKPKSLTLIEKDFYLKLYLTLTFGWWPSALSQSTRQLIV